MTGQRLQCSAAPVYLDQHMATDRKWHVTDPDGRQFAFCSGGCLLTYAVHGALPADLQHTSQQSETQEAA